MIAKRVFTGIAVGLILTAIGFYLYVEFLLKVALSQAVKTLSQQGNLGTVLFIAAIPNLLAFFIFINRGQDYKARGIIIASFIIAFLILIAQFL
ncbi:MAG: hypothetical protein QNJ57_04250 [Flavobacteriaceae bacterium]|nr:hypothetical protein [Flavobacteriaceae bacterium]